MTPRRLFALSLALLAIGLWCLTPGRAQFGAVKPLIASCSQGGNDSFTKILLHFSNNFVDSAAGSVAGRTWTPNGLAVTSGLASKFAPAGLQANGDYIDTADSADFSVGAGNWTVDFWLNRRGSTTVNDALFAQSPSSGLASASSIGAMFTASNFITGFVSDGSIYLGNFITTIAINDSLWHHFAMVRNGNTVLMFVDGVQADSESFTGTVPNSTARFGIGRFGEYTAVSDFDGDIDEFRLSPGIARWTSAFTPPPVPYCP